MESQNQQLLESNVMQVKKLFLPDKIYAPHRSLNLSKIYILTSKGQPLQPSD
jgi:hypothetical protein